MALRSLKNSINEMSYRLSSGAFKKYLSQQTINNIRSKRIGCAEPYWNRRQISKSFRSKPEREKAFTISIAVILEELATKGDKGIELAQYFDFLERAINVSNLKIKELRQQVVISRRQGTDLDKAVSTYRKIFANDQSNYQILYAALCYLILSSEPNRFQLEFLNNIAAELEISQNEQTRIYDFYSNLYRESAFEQIDKTQTIRTHIKEQKDPRLKALRILGCDSFTTNEQLREKYRALILKYHPDKIAALGAKEREIQNAREKMLEISQAYSFIKQNSNTLN
jgi:DnaJ-domain-containing protein 1